MAAAQDTPESDTGSFECFRNYTAPEVFIQGLAGIVDQQDVESMIRAQKQMWVSSLMLWLLYIVLIYLYISNLLMQFLSLACVLYVCRLQRFEKTNEMLTNCNQLSVHRLKTAGTEFKKHIALLIEMKRDLDYIFKRIRLVKNKLSQQYPQAFNGN